MDEEILGSTEPAQAEPVAPSDAPVAAAESKDHFFDASQLAPELQDQWKRMQGAYTKKMQGFSQAREAAEIVRRFNTDPDFARATIMQRAQALGLNIGGQESRTPGAMQQGTGQMPAQLVEAVKANLSPELQWMAPALAASQWAGMQMALQPIKEQQDQSVRSTRNEQYEELAAELSAKAPGWEQYEEEMQSLLSFLQSDKMKDRKHGSKLELIHRLVVGDGQATAEAARRMAQASRFRNPAGTPATGSTQPNIAEQVRKPTNNQEAFALAAKFAMGEMARQGVKV